MSLSTFIPMRHVIIEEKKPPKIKMVNQYLLVTKLGTGYFSKVYLALANDQNSRLSSNSNQDIKESKSYYAAKAVRVHERRLASPASTNLEREIKILRSLDHPNIIKLHSVIYAPSIDIAYVIMEWANCGTLQQAISNDLKFDERTIASIFLQIALALSYLHTKGIAHRDVKPSNILLFSDGTAKLSDFGISHSFGSAESVLGTPSYQAPDLFDEGEYDNISTFHSESNNDSFNDLLFINNIDDDFSSNHIGLQNRKGHIVHSNSYQHTTSFNTTNVFQQQKPCDDIFSMKENLKFEYSKNNNFTNNNYKIFDSGDDDLNDDENNNKNEEVKEKRIIDPKKGDVWSLGVSLYQVAYGILPYDGKNLYEIIRKINNSTLYIPQNNGEIQYSPMFVDLIQKMLCKNPDNRLSMDEVIQHPFFSRFQFPISPLSSKSDSNLIIINKRKGMERILFDIKPFQPPQNLPSQIVKIDAMVCPENYSFSNNLRSVSCPSWTYALIEDDQSENDVRNTQSVNSPAYV